MERRDPDDARASHYTGNPVRTKPLAWWQSLAKLSRCTNRYIGSGYNCWMKTDEILASIDAEIAVLKQARAILLGSSETITVATPKKRKKMSAETRAKMAAAQKMRWSAILTKKA